MNEIILKDAAQIHDTIRSRLAVKEKFEPVGIARMVDLETGEVKWEKKNRVVITGGILNASYIFGLPVSTTIPTYNSEMNLDKSVETGTIPDNNPCTCLFCVDDSGCGPTQKDVYTVNYIDRISPDTIFPFRYVDIDKDISEELREYYFGKKTIISDDKIAYYFKKPDTEPQLHLRYTDGTQLSDEDIYNIASSQSAECFVETRLRINRYDFRDYMDQVIGWENARFSSISLCYAWYRDIEEDGQRHRYYQNITPYTKLNFPFNWLYDLTKGCDFIYDIYF